MPIDYSKYPANWKDLRAIVLERAGNCCEGSPAYPQCRVPNQQSHPITGSRVVLTIAHMDQNIKNNSLDNLRALCQRCHLKHDLREHLRKRLRKNRPLLSGLEGF